MRRKLFTFVTATSAVLCAFCLVFGLLGYRESGDVRIEWIGRSHAAVLLSDHGTLAVVFSSGWPAADWVNDRHVRTLGEPTPLTYYPAVVADGTIERLAFTDGVAGATVTYRGVRTNVLFAIVFAAALPVTWCMLRIKARRRNQVGHCRRCGYDLRATPERCPECGGIQRGRRQRPSDRVPQPTTS